MIDLGISKLALIGVVALVVIGPEKLPKVARMAGSLFGRAQRYLNEVKAEVSREIELDELNKIRKDMQQAASDMKRDIAENVAHVSQEIHSAFDGAGNPLSDLPTPDQLAAKNRNFRKKKLARVSAIPTWYKKQHSHKTRVTSAAARVAKYRPALNSGKSSFY